MFPLPREFASPIVKLLALLALLQLATYIPGRIAQNSYHEKCIQFTELWNTGGAIALAMDGITPSKSEENLRRHSFLATYVQESFFYKIWMVPAWAGTSAFLFSWVLQPGLLTLVLSLWGLLYAGQWLETKWMKFLPSILMIAASIIAATLYYGIVWGLMSKHGDLPYCGINAAAALAVGALARLHKPMIPWRYWWKSVRTVPVHPWMFAGIWIALDFIVQVFVNPINYGWGFVFDLIALMAGFGFAPKIPLRVQAVTAARRTVTNPLEQVRAQLAEGWRLASLLEGEAALGEIDRAIRALLRSSTEAGNEILQATLTQLMDSKHPLPINAQQWYEWGIEVSERKMPLLAVNCLENAIKTPGIAIETARAAIVQTVELRMVNGLQPEQGKPWLERVIKTRADDLIGRRAQKLLDSLG